MILLWLQRKWSLVLVCWNPLSTTYKRQPKNENERKKTRFAAFLQMIMNWKWEKQPRKVSICLFSIFWLFKRLKRTICGRSCLRRNEPTKQCQPTKQTQASTCANCHQTNKYSEQKNAMKSEKKPFVWSDPCYIEHWAYCEKVFEQTETTRKKKKKKKVNERNET